MKPRRTAVQRTHRVLLVVLGVLFLALFGTGLWLAFRYQPSGSFVGAHPRGWVRTTHSTASTLFLLTALVTFGLSIAVSYERALKRGTPAWVVGLVVLLGSLAALGTGHVLPWDQLALAPVRRAEFRGFGFLFGHSSVHFVLVGSSEVTKDALRSAFLLHTAVIPVALLVLGALGLRLTRSSRVVPLSE